MARPFPVTVAFPNAALIIDASGNVFGTTSPRGQSRQSTFFKVAS